MMPAISAAMIRTAPDLTGSSIATAPPVSAPTNSWPSAPMFHTRPRNASARPTPMMMSGVACAKTSPMFSSLLNAPLISAW